MKCEGNRLKSFGMEWPYHGSLSRENMAAAGFFFQGPHDRVTCPFCKVFIDQWEDIDDPLLEHQLRCSTGCPFLQQRGLAAAAHNSPTYPLAGQNTHMDAYIYENHASYQPTDSTDTTDSGMEDPTNRLATFGHWPKSNVKYPYELYPAGFYYTGYGDRVCCFVCRGLVEGWNSIDNAWSEHARLFPDCEYVRTNKGEFYIDQVLNRPNVVTLKDKLRTYATQRGFTKYEIDQVLGEIYNDEEEMRQAVATMTDQSY